MSHTNWNATHWGILKSKCSVLKFTWYVVIKVCQDLFVSVRSIPWRCLSPSQWEGCGIAPKELEVARAEVIVPIYNPRKTFHSIPVNSLVEFLVPRHQCSSLLSEKQMLQMFHNNFSKWQISQNSLNLVIQMKESHCLPYKKYVNKNYRACWLLPSKIYFKLAFY